MKPLRWYEVAFFIACLVTFLAVVAYAVYIAAQSLWILIK